MSAWLHTDKGQHRVSSHFGLFKDVRCVFFSFLEANLSRADRLPLL